MHTRMLGCLALLLSAGMAQAEIHEHTLANGLKVIVKEDHRAPVVVQQIWYRVGSMDESTGVTGVAHVLEHMMFKGTKNVPAGEFSRRIAAAGGRENAFTSHDYTAYFQQLHKSRLPLAMALEADRMSNLHLSAAEFAKEIQVVMEERRMRTEDEPRALLYEKLLAAAFTEHPYQHPIIGWMNDLQNMTDADVRNWYRSWYAPNNAVLVVVGDVEAATVFKLAEKYYGAARRRPLPVRKALQEPPQRGIKRITVQAPAELPHLMLAWHAPSLHDAERDRLPYALQVLAGVLDGNDSARLNKALVRTQQLASEVGASYDPVARGPALFLVEATPSVGRSIAELEAALRAELQRVAREGIGEEELQRVKAQVMAAEVYQRDSVFYQAMQIGRLESVGLGHAAIPVLLQKLQSVTAAEVQQAAQRVLVDTQLTVGVLDPQPLPPGQGMPRTGGRHAY